MNNRLDPFDELAAMFLTAPQPQPPRAGPEPQEARDSAVSRPQQRETPMRGQRTMMTELLIVGHLPVRAGLWLVPYADAMARSAGSVALLRLDGQEPSLQLLRAPEALATASLGMPLQQTILDLAGHVDAWVLRASEGLSADEAIDCRPDRITILSSADEAAVVAAYQTVKELAQAAQHPHRTLPPMGLAMVGCDAQAAATVIDRLNRTTVSFLGVAVTLSGLLPRMDASIKCTRYVTFGREECPSVMNVREWIEQTKTMAPRAIGGHAALPAEPQPDVIGRVHAAPEAFVVDATRILRSPSPWQSPPQAPVPLPEQPVARVPAPPPPPPIMPEQPQPTAASHGKLSRSAAEELASAIAPGTVRLPPKVVMELEHKRPPSQRPVIEPDDRGQPIPLAKFVTGLTPLAIRPPGHERVELAVDAQGGLHVLARETCLRELPVVARWAHVHHELLAMAFPQQTFRPDAQAICHVFTAEPALLADLHGSDLRLHVLAPVTVGDNTAWYAAPLNIVT